MSNKSVYYILEKTATPIIFNHYNYNFIYYINCFLKISTKFIENKLNLNKFKFYQVFIFNCIIYSFIFYLYCNVNYKRKVINKLSLTNFNSNIDLKFNTININYVKHITTQFISNYNIFFSKIIYLKEYSLKNILLKERIQFMTYLSQYFILFLNNRFNKKIALQASKYHVSEVSFYQFKYSIIKKLNSAPNIKRLRIKFKIFIKVIYILLKYKDLEVFKRWLEISMTRLPFKFHRRFLYTLKVIFFLYLFPYFKHFNVLGLVIKTSGKIGLGGNSKTKSYYIKAGKYPRTSKSFKILFTQSNIFTLSGALGLSYYFTYL